MNAAIRLDAFERLFTRAVHVGRNNAFVAQLKVATPDARVWIRTEARTPRLTYERRDAAGTWQECERDELTREQWEAITLYVTTEGRSADPRIASARFLVDCDRWDITYRDAARAS